MRRTATLRRNHAMLGTLGALVFVIAACSDSIHLNPSPDPAGGGTGGAGPGVGGGGPGGGGSGGGFGLECSSNPDCLAPAAICDTVQHACVECLEFADCAFRPGTVCSLGHCICPDVADSFCESPARCVNPMTARDDCGQCGHGCFGTCNAGKCGEPWEPTSLTGAPPGRSQHVAVWTGSRMLVWGGTLQSGGMTNTGGIFDPAGRSWMDMSTANAPSARRLATAVWTGTAMIVWGGISGGPLGTGGVFDPVTNTWKAISTSGAPSPRYYHTAVWTGSEMLVWGGYDNTNYLGDGAGYNPATNTWAPIPGSGSPPLPRREHTAIWTGTNMIAWGGYGYDSILMGDTYFGDGGIYDPASSTWTPISLAAAPSPRTQHTAVWTGAGAEMIVWGGVNGNVLNDGAKYNATGASWTPMNGPFPAARQWHKAVWLGNQMIMWGGQDNSVSLDSGGIYDPVMNKWDAMPTAPVARTYHTVVETGTMMIVWGGSNGNALNDGAIFNPAFMP